MNSMLLFGLLSAQAYAAEPTSSLDNIILAKQKMKTADAYMQRNEPGNALVQLLEARGILHTTILDPRIQAAKSALTDVSDFYKINLRVQDNTQTERGNYLQHYLQSQLMARNYANGVEIVEDGGNYTLTVDLQRLHIEQKESSLSHLVHIPIGQTRVPNGEYTALQQRINVDCQQYLIAQQQAQGAGIEAVAGLDTTINSANTNNLWGVALGVTSMVDATNRNSNAIRTNAACQQELNVLAQTPMFTAETQTTTARDTETTTRKTADLGVRLYLTAGKGMPVFSSPPFVVTFYKEDYARDEIADLGIRGDPAESISDDEVTMGVFSSADNTIYAVTSNGGGLRDAIVLWRAKNSTGESALELYTQLFFQGYTKPLRQIGEDYILAHSSVSKDDLDHL